MTTTQILASTNVGSIYSHSAGGAYSLARGGNAMSASTATGALQIGQGLSTGDYEVREGFAEFLSIPAGASAATSASIDIRALFRDTTKTWELQVRGPQDYGAAPVTTADFVAGASLSGITRLAYINNTALNDDTSYVTMTNDGLLAAVQAAAGGTLRVILVSKDEVDNTAPVNSDETAYIYLSDATKGLRLNITYPDAPGTVVVTSRGTGGNNTGATSLTITPASTLAAGTMGVLVIAADNAGSGGATTVMPASITDAAGNTWTRRLNPIYDPGSASAGVDVGVYTAPIVTALSGNIVVNWAAGVSVTAKAWTLTELSIVGGGSFTYLTGAAGTGSATGTPTITTSSITSGDIVVGVGGAESADTWVEDGDTTNGTWSTHQGAGFGTGTSGMSVISQVKVVTATATQTFNPTLTSADVILGWISIDPVPDTKLMAQFINGQVAVQQSYRW